MPAGTKRLPFYLWLTTAKVDAIFKLCPPKKYLNFTKYPISDINPSTGVIQSGHSLSKLPVIQKTVTQETFVRKAGFLSLSISLNRISHQLICKLTHNETHNYSFILILITLAFIFLLTRNHLSLFQKNNVTTAKMNIFDLFTSKV